MQWPEDREWGKSQHTQYHKDLRAREGALVIDGKRGDHDFAGHSLSLYFFYPLTLTGQVCGLFARALERLKLSVLYKS